MKYISDEELLSCGTAPGACWVRRAPANRRPPRRTLKQQSTLRTRHYTRARSQVAIDGDVLDISAFMDHHPGGPEIISELRGRDASQMFLDVGHSPEARTMLRQFVVGKLQAVPRFLAPRSALLAAASWLQPRAPGGRLARNAVAATVAAVFTAATCWLASQRMPRGRDALRLVYG